MNKPKPSFCPWCHSKDLEVYIEPRADGHDASIGCNYCGIRVMIGWSASGISREDCYKDAVETYNARKESNGTRRNQSQ